MAWLGHGGGACDDHYRRVVAAAAGGDRRNGRGFGIDDRANGWKHHARRRPACKPQLSPDGSAVIFYREIAASFNRGEGVQVRRLNTLT